MLPGSRIGNYLPALASVPPFSSGTQLFRTEMECPGRRYTGEVFLANIWFSTYRTRSGPRLAAVVVDVSEDLRNREESSLQQFMAGSRIEQYVNRINNDVIGVIGGQDNSD